MTRSGIKIKYKNLFIKTVIGIEIYMDEFLLF